MQQFYMPVSSYIREEVGLSQPCLLKKATNREPSAWAYNGAILSLSDMYAGTWFCRLRIVCKVDDVALLKKNIVAKSKDVKTGSNMAESCKEGCGSKRAALPIMMI
jgi:hypothetical protein